MALPSAGRLQAKAALKLQNGKLQLKKVKFTKPLQRKNLTKFKSLQNEKEKKREKENDKAKKKLKNANLDN